MKRSWVLGICAATALALPATAVAAPGVNKKPVARLTLQQKLPRQHRHWSGVGSAQLPTSRATRLVCALHNRGPAAVPRLHVRLAFETAQPDNWRVTLPDGRAVSGGVVIHAGRLAVGATKNVPVLVKPLSAKAAQLTATCQADPSHAVRIQQPRIDRAGDKGVAGRLTPR